MRTMAEMQADILRRARFDGGYPKVIHMGMGTICLARSKEHEARIRREIIRGWVFAIITVVGFFALMFFYGMSR